jgi:hypothetical protein
MFKGMVRILCLDVGCYCSTSPMGRQATDEAS